MTLYIQTLHRIFDTATAIVPVAERGLVASPSSQIVDLCSGAGGPMPEVLLRLRKRPGFENLELLLTDYYPNRRAIALYEKDIGSNVQYLHQSVDAANVPPELNGMRTMICSLHHMKPQDVKAIFSDAIAKRQPFLAFELSDNSSPRWLWWAAIPVGFLMSIVLSIRVRPLGWFQILGTYFIPILPLCIAWDGAVSNARTYTQQDLEQIIGEIESIHYDWEIGTVKHPGIPGRMSYILGIPEQTA